ncbi:hypothetical protein F5Y05DRAFT_265434 [Hypoxylon sp. FL0543]|nr:hypothetical protein F5Y05DRAFT_265434 [Hypoxylon sp. FL0543]
MFVEDSTRKYTAKARQTQLHICSPGPLQQVASTRNLSTKLQSQKGAPETYLLLLLFYPFFSFLPTSQISSLAYSAPSRVICDAASVSPLSCPIFALASVGVIMKRDAILKR